MTPQVSRRLVCLSPDWFGRDMLTVVGVFELCWRDVPEVAEEAVVVEPIDPFEGASSRSSKPWQGPLLWTSSVL